ncbi:MAG: type II secretion system F family protein [Candidatus Aenigmatarchaeota archaeon]
MNKKPFFLRISLNEKIIFVRNLSMLLKSGISIVEALEILKNNTKSKTLIYILNEAISDVQRGQFLSNSLNKFKNVFGEFFVNIIRVGELTGKLPENLDKLADELAQIGALKRKIITTMIYPTFIITTMVVLVIFVLYFVFPKILPIFENLGVELPLTTKIFIKVSYFLINNTTELIIFLIIFILSFFIALRFPKSKFYIDLFLLNLPLLSDVIKKYILAEFSRILSLLLGSGLKIVESIEIAGNALTNNVYKKILIDVSSNVLSGYPLNESLEKFPKLFPYNFVKMIEIGERTGNLEKNLRYLSQNFEEDVDTFLERFINILEPLILVIIAATIGFMAISIILPIYELSEKIQP